jgi:hypothetical protein
MMKNKLQFAAGAVSLLAATAWSADVTNNLSTAVTAPTTVTAWKPQAGLSVKESWDNNVLAVSGRGLMAEQASWITTVSPLVGIGYAPAASRASVVQLAALSYAPDFVTFHNAPSESYNAHRFIGAVKENAYSIGTVRERREQLQDRADVTFQYDWRNCFVRPTATLLYYDMMTDLRNDPFYKNYADRSDVNGGLDFGYKISDSLAVTLGYRYGHQYQEAYHIPGYALDGYSSTSDYQRVLLGLEGKIFSWLKVSLRGGPDFRDYESNTASHTTPLDDLHPIKYYGEALLVATLTDKDTLTFKYKQWQWVSMTGVIPYFDSTYNLTYHRNVTKALGLELTGQALEANYNSGNLSACQRDDWQYTAAISLNYAFNAHFSATLAYTWEMGRSQEDNVANQQFREYDCHAVSLGASCKF